MEGKRGRRVKVRGALEMAPVTILPGGSDENGNSRFVFCTLELRRGGACRLVLGGGGAS